MQSRNDIYHTNENPGPGHYIIQEPKAQDGVTI